MELSGRALDVPELGTSVEEIAMSTVKLIVGLVAAGVLVAFGAQNTQAVTLHFLIFKAPSMPMVLALFAAALLGALLAWIVSAPDRFRRMRERRNLRNRVSAHEPVELSSTPEDSHSLRQNDAPAGELRPDTRATSRDRAEP